MKSQIKNIVRWIHINLLRCRAISAKEISLSGRVLIIAPHPDDEVIGCGGLIGRCLANNNPPHILFMTGGEGSHKDCCNLNASEIVTERRKLTREALNIFGLPLQNIHELGYPDGGISLDNTLIDQLKQIIDEIEPSTIFIPHWGEGWPDHVKTAEIVKSILSSDTAVYEYCVWMWYYNVWRGLDWKNAALLRMTPHEHELKLRAMDAYISPLAPCGNPWSGVLPPIFIKANSGNSELYFKVR